MKKVNILAFGAHPDDVELSCAGTLLKMVASGKTVGIVDLTDGEMGTRGSPEIRKREADAAAAIIGASFRYSLHLRDGFLFNDERSQVEIIKAIRACQPDVILANAVADRHPDHGRGAILVREAAFASGLARIATVGSDGIAQQPWRPRRVYHYIQDRLMMPSFVVDITPHFAKKMQAIKAFSSQFHDPNSSEPATYISAPEFFPFIEARAREMGHLAGSEFGEGFVSETPLKVEDLLG